MSGPGNEACDFYHNFREDLLIAKELGATQFRISVSWCRIFPNGDGPVNQAGLHFYKEVVDYMIAIGLEPVVTCYHWDLPQVICSKFFFKGFRIYY